jgi:polysaccharide export outer membrane protein
MLCMMPLPGQAAAADNAAAGYVIGQGDVLTISVWKDESLTRDVVVLPDGTISFPLIGNIAAEGKTVDELKAEIVSKLRKYVPDPVLNVAVRSVNSMFIYVIGRVNNPGRFALAGNINVLQALATAGGLNPFADNNGIRIIRSGDGGPTTLSFRYDDVARGKRLEQNVMLRRGDVVVVP